MTENERAALDHFGKLIAEDLRDNAMASFDILAHKKGKAPSVQDLQKQIADFTQQQKQVIRRCLLNSVDSAIHNFLFKLQEQADFDTRIKILVDGHNILECSDGIHGEIFLDDGWFAKFSNDGEPPEIT